MTTMPWQLKRSECMLRSRKKKWNQWKREREKDGKDGPSESWPERQYQERNLVLIEEDLGGQELDVAGNFPGHRKYERSNWMCYHVGGHLTQCEAYKDLRGDHDLENQEELAEFFMKVMNRRKEKAMMRDRSTATQQEPSCSSQIVLVMIIWVQYIGYLTKGPTGQNRLSNFWLVFWNIFLKLLKYVLLERTPETKLSS